MILKLILKQSKLCGIAKDMTNIRLLGKSAIDFNKNQVDF